jgi:hypothetical protein
MADPCNTLLTTHNTDGGLRVGPSLDRIGGSITSPTGDGAGGRDSVTVGCVPVR